MQFLRNLNGKRVISGILASIMLSQAFIYGDGTCKGLLHNDTIKAMAETQDEQSNYSNYTSSYEEVSDIAVSGYIGLEDGRNREITVLVFDDSWNTIASTTVSPNEYFSISANNISGSTSTTHIKIECNGYLPRFYKDMGFGSYQLGTQDNPEVLLFGDTTYNEGADNQWSDEVINNNDLDFIYEQKGKIKGDENYDEYYDFNQDNRIDNEDVKIIAQYDGAIYENDVLYTSSTKESYYINPLEVLKYDLNHDNVINSEDQQVLCDLYPYTTFKGDEDFDKFAYMDINENNEIDENDCEYFKTYINNHNGCNPYNDYIYNLTLTGDSYHNGAMYLENTNLDLDNYKLTVNGNFVFRTANPYQSMWNGNPEVTLNINGGTLFIADQFDFGQANSYDKIIMTNENGRLYVNGIWNYVTLSDMEGLWTAGTIYFFGSTWQVNEASGDKSIYSTGTHSICFYYASGQQVIRWANTQDCIYNQETGEYNTLRRFNFDYVDDNGNCLGVTFPCGYSDDRYYFRASLPEELTLSKGATIPYEDWDDLINIDGGDKDHNKIPDVIDDQIATDNYESIPNEWLEDKYGDEVDEFLKNEEIFSDDDLTGNKKSLIDFLYYLYDSYDQNSPEFEEAMKVFNYFKDSLTQIVLGDYTDKTTLLGTAGQIIISLIPAPQTQAIDLVFDLRDLSENFLKNFNPDSPEWWIDLTVDSIALIPEVGTSIKQLKKLDDLTGLKGLSKFMYNKLMKIVCDENGNFIKSADEIAELVKDFTKDIERLKANYKQINELVENKGADEVFETYYKYGIEVLETLSKYKEYYDQIIEIIQNVSDINKIMSDINKYGIDYFIRYEIAYQKLNDVNKAIISVNEFHTRLEAYQSDNVKYSYTIGTYPVGTSDYEILGKELYNAGVPYPSYNFQRHHIIPLNSDKVATARKILLDNGIQINSASNAVFLPSVYADSSDLKYVITESLHGYHYDYYYEEVNQRIVDTYNMISSKTNDHTEIVKALCDELSNIRMDLLTGKLTISIKPN